MLGVVHAKRVLANIARGEPPDFTTQLSPCLYVLETLTAMELLAQFRGSEASMAFVLDEYGEIEGLVTLQNVLDSVTGEFGPIDEDDAWSVQRADGSWLLDGALAVPELKDALELKQVPEEAKGRYHTLAGMLMLLLGKVPENGDHTEWEGWRFEIVDMDGKRIDKVLASPLMNIQPGEGAATLLASGNQPPKRLS